MALVVQAGQVNTQSLLAPGVIVQILPPSQSLINGVPSNIIGVVGTSTWGLLNTPTTVGSMTEQTYNFGFPVARAFDLGTPVYAATLNQANNFICVRVSDGTDTAASKAILDVTTPTPVAGMTVSGIYTGTLGNSISVTVSNGQTPSTYQVVVALPPNLGSGRVPEVFNNIPGTGATLWQNIVNAINLGQNGARGPSELITAAIGTATGLPALSTYKLTGGTDGAGSITTAKMIGTDVSPRTGMYALRSTQCSVAMLADLTDVAVLTTQESFGVSEGIFMHCVGVAGQTLAQAASVVQTAGLNNYDVKFLVGDWCYMFDPFNGMERLVSPQGFACGVKANQPPNESALNSQILGIVGTQTTEDGGTYSNADVVFACNNGLDFIYNPSPGGKYFSLQTGQNTSSDTLTRMDAYTTLTNYLAYSIAGGVGSYIGKLQSPTIRVSAKATIYSFLQNLFNVGYIGNVNYPNEFSQSCTVVLDANNNPDTSVALGYMQSNVQVVTYSVIRNFLVNLQSGQVSLTNATST